MAIAVTTVGSEILAIVLPNNIVVMNSPVFATTLSSLAAFLSPSCTFACSFTLSTAVNAVSLPEKNNEANNKNMIKKTKKSSPFCDPLQRSIIFLKLYQILQNNKFYFILLQFIYF